MKAHIAVLPGDGVGPEVTTEAVRALRALAAQFDHDFEFTEAPIGGVAIDATGAPLPPETLALCERSDAVLLGAIGGPRWDNPAAPVRPEQGLLELRKRLAVFANIRPVRLCDTLSDRGPLRADLARDVDLVIVRELTGGLYFGKREEGEQQATDECKYTTAEIERIVRVACRIASGRAGRLVSLDKANVLATSRLWRRTVDRIARTEFPGLRVEHMLIDSAAMRLVTHASTFDVIVTENMFGDIISDLASVLCGSIGLLGSASLGDGGPGLYEPIHGSAPDIAGRATANPIGAIAAASMLLRMSLNLRAEADALDHAIDATLAEGVTTPDLGGAASTSDVGRAIEAHILASPITADCTTRA